VVFRLTGAWATDCEIAQGIAAANDKGAVMSTSTDGEVSFGIKFDEGFEFPWDEESDDGECSHSFDGDIDEWWRAMNGFDRGDYPFDERGNYKPGIKSGDPCVMQYYSRQNAWDAANPVPVKLVNYQHCDCPAYIIAIPQSVVTANRGSPVELNADTFKGGDAAKVVLIDFCKRFGIEMNDQP